jgi:hypothetical protein
LTGTFWSLSAGRAAMASRCLTVSGNVKYLRGSEAC